MLDGLFVQFQLLLKLRVNHLTNRFRMRRDFVIFLTFQYLTTSRRSARPTCRMFCPLSSPWHFSQSNRGLICPSTELLATVKPLLKCLHPYLVRNVPFLRFG